MPMFTNVEAHFGNNQGKLKCGALGEPVPSLYWIQPSGKATKFNPPALSNNGEEATGGGEHHRIEGVLSLNWGEDSSLPSGMYICIANNEAGNVTLTINLQSPNRPVSASAYVLKTDWGGSTPVGGAPTPTHHSTVNNEIKVNNIIDHVTSQADSGGGLSPVKEGGVDSVAVNQILPRHLGDSLSLRASPASSRSGVQQVGQPADWLWTQRGGDGGVVSVPVDNNLPLYSLNNGGTPLAEERLFTVGELAWAVVSTHVLTLFLCLIVLAVLYRTHCCRSKYVLVQLLPCGSDRQQLAKREQRQQQMQLYAGSGGGSCGSGGGYGGGTHKSVTSSSRDDVTECVYLNGLRHHRLQSYTDSPMSIKR